MTPPPLLALLADVLQVLLQVTGRVPALLLVVHYLPSASLRPAAGRQLDGSLRLRDRETFSNTSDYYTTSAYKINAL